MVRLLLSHPRPLPSLQTVLLLIFLDTQPHAFIDGMDIAHFIEDIEQKHESFRLIILGLEVAHDPGL